jgi:hypothetical protein
VGPNWTPFLEKNAIKFQEPAVRNITGNHSGRTVKFRRWDGPYQQDLIKTYTTEFSQSCTNIWATKKLRGFVVRKRTIPTERPPLLRIEGVAQRIPTAVNLGFIDRSRWFSIQVAPQLSSRSWVDTVPDPLLVRKPGSTSNRTRDPCVSSQKLWPLDHRYSL